MIDCLVWRKDRDFVLVSFGEADFRRDVLSAVATSASELEHRSKVSPVGIPGDDIDIEAAQPFVELLAGNVADQPLTK